MWGINFVITESLHSLIRYHNDKDVNYMRHRISGHGPLIKAMDSPPLL